ncbi:PEP-CTERM sorting domain-containing protein [Pontiellaceae bacterium B12219]|nr:PEP-CTERM sorting domain-containing protein [Pontiellaceae bacterium B12219]
MKKAIFLIAGFAMAGSLQANVIVDHLDNTDNISHSFGGALVSDNGGSGIVTIQKTSTEFEDTGMDWQLGGAAGGSMDVNVYTSTSITPYGPVNNGSYHVSIVLFDSLGDYIAEPEWISHTQDTAKQTLTLTDLIDSAGYSESGVASWTMRIRVNEPTNVMDSGFGFTAIEVNSVPEPATMVSMLLGMGGIVLIRRLRL